MSRFVHMILLGLVAWLGTGLARVVAISQASDPAPIISPQPATPRPLLWDAVQDPAELGWQITFQHLATWGQKGSGPGQFDGLSDIALDATSGLLYAAETNNHRIQVLNANGWHSGSLGSYGAAPGQLDGPTRLAISADGRIYVLDRGNDRVQVFDSSGERLAGWPQRRPRDVALSAGGVVVVLHEPSIPEVAIYSPMGEQIDRFSLWDGRGSLVDASHLVTDSGGMLYAVDNNRRRVVAYTLAGEYRFEWPLAIGSITGIGLSPDGLLYASSLEGETTVYTLQGIQLGALPAGGATSVLPTGGNPATIYLAYEDHISIYQQVIHSWEQWTYLPLVVRPLEDPNTPTPTESPDPSVTARPSATAMPTETPTPIATPEPSPTATMTRWSTPTSTHSPDATPSATQTVTGEPLPTPTPWTDSYEPNDSFDQAWGPILPGQPYTSYIWSRTDEDYYYLDALNLDRITVSLANPPPNTDYDLYLYDSEREPVAKSERLGSAEYISYVPSQTGWYYVQVRSYDGRSNRHHWYMLQANYGVKLHTPTATSVSPYPPPPTNTRRPPSKTPTVGQTKGSPTPTPPAPTNTPIPPWTDTPGPPPSGTKAPSRTPTPRR